MKRCSFCNKETDFLVFDKFHGVDCMDIEGEFCIDCRRKFSSNWEEDYSPDIPDEEEGLSNG